MSDTKDELEEKFGHVFPVLSLCKRVRTREYKIDQQLICKITEYNNMIKK